MLIKKKRTVTAQTVQKKGTSIKAQKMKVHILNRSVN